MFTQRDLLFRKEYTLDLRGEKKQRHDADMLKERISLMKSITAIVSRRVFSQFALALALSLGLAALVESPMITYAATATAYYVDCSQSIDGSGTLSSPWNSLTDVDSHAAFNAGDSILFKTGKHGAPGC